jgi:peptidoglycan/LPS O-acetylase OafA/YrhL
VRSRRFHELDLLRFVAAASVMLFHYTVRGPIAENLPPLTVSASLVPVGQYGFLGVSLFFLISGFVILMTAANGSVKHFAVSRVVRLYPAFWVACTATFLALMVLPHHTPTPTFREYLLNLTMVSGFAHVPYVDGVYWSLLVEIRFYVLVFLLLVLGQIGRVKPLFGAWLVLYVITTVHPLPILTTLLLPGAAPYFIAGAMLYLISREGLSPYKVALIVACYVVSAWELVRDLGDIQSKTHTTLSPIALCAIVGAFYVVGLLVSTGRTARFASDRWILLGALTYPLYLVHQRIGYGLLTLGHGRLPPSLLFWGVVAAMMAAAYVVTRIERVAAPRMRAYLLGKARQPALAPAPKIAA